MLLRLSSLSSYTRIFLVKNMHIPFFQEFESAEVSKMLLAALLALPTILAVAAPKSTVSPNVLDNLKLFAEFSATAYCEESYVRCWDITSFRYIASHIIAMCDRCS